MRAPQRSSIRDLATLWSDFTWRHWKHSPGSTTVLMAILALGVGVFFSIRLANRAAVAGFTVFTETLNGESDLVIRSPSGSLQAGVLSEIRAALGSLPVSLFPVLETTATQARGPDADDGFNAEQFHVVGVDLLALPNLIFLSADPYRPPVSPTEANTETSSSSEVTWRLGTSSKHQVFITQNLADRDKLQVGDTLSLIIGDEPQSFEVVGVLPETELSANKPIELLVMDLPQLQSLTGQPNVIDRIEVRLPVGTMYESWLNETQHLLAQAESPQWTVELPQRQRQTGAIMTRAFRLNLSVLSSLALLVGVYLIFQALEAAVIKRRTEIGTLRSLGVPQQTIMRAWLMESLSLGLVGSALGLIIGYAGAQLAVRAIAQTVNSLYYSNTTQAAEWNLGEAGLAITLGLVASLIAGWLPARDAASTPPAQVLQRGNFSTGLSLLARPHYGAVCLMGAWLVSLSPPIVLGPGVHFPLGGYVSAFLWVLGASILGSLLFAPVARLLRQFGNHSAEKTYASSHLRVPSGRHRLTAAGLIVAVGMAAGMSLLIKSFESTMVSWIHQALKADLYIAVQGVGNISSANRLRPETWRRIAQTPGVSQAEVGQMYPITFRGASTHLVGASFGDRSGWRYMVWVREPETAFHELDHTRTPTPALINESFQQRFRVAVGDTLQIPTPSKTQSVDVVGIFADYGNERGAIVVSRERLAEWYRDYSALNVALHLDEQQDPDVVRRKLMSEHPGLVVRTNRRLREEVMTVFHATFSVTHALKWIGISVALVGLALGMTSILLERRNELRVLKELGMQRRDIARTVIWEGLGLTGVSLVTGLALSIALGHLLIYVINYQSFGWTLAFVLPWWDMVFLSLGVLTIAGIVCWSIGYRAGDLPSDREE